MRNIIFAEGEYYHVYNRGVDKRSIFQDEDDFKRFLKVTQKLLGEGLLGDSHRRPLQVQLFAYCLNPNHFHLLFKLVGVGDLTKFMHSLGTSYTMYFNKKNGRSGRLFANTFKAVHVDSEAQLIWLLTYINFNAEIHGVIARAQDYVWCSCRHYLEIESNPLLTAQPVRSDRTTVFGQKEFMKMEKARKARLSLEA